MLYVRFLTWLCMFTLYSDSQRTSQPPKSSSSSSTTRATASIKTAKGTSTEAAAETRKSTILAVPQAKINKTKLTVTTIASTFPDQQIQTIPPNSYSTLYKWSPTSQVFTSSGSDVLEEEDKECRNIATAFAYEHNLCDAHSPEAYSLTAPARLTCNQRCGFASTSGKLRSECACDALCVVYNYCCWDMSTECAQEFAKGQRLKRYIQEKNLNPECNELGFTVFRKNVAEGVTRLSTTFSPFSTTPVRPKKVRKVFSSGNPAMQYPLKSFIDIEKLVHSSVVDLSTGIIYGHYWVDFETTRTEAASKPQFISEIKTLSCPEQHKFTSSIEASIAEVLSQCVVSATAQALSPAHQWCPGHLTLSCSCPGGRLLRGHLHDVCLGGNIPASELTSKLNFDPEVLKLSLWPPGSSSCAVFRGETLVSSVDREEKSGMTITVAHVFSNRTQTSRPVYTNGKCPGLGECKEDHPLKERLRNIYNSVDLVLESSHTLERRLVCQGRSSVLSACRLLECVPGALLSTTLLSQDQAQFSGRSCLRPGLSVVRHPRQASIPLCVCLRASLALASLGLWRTRNTRSVTEQCLIDLQTIGQGEERKHHTILRWAVPVALCVVHNFT